MNILKMQNKTLFVSSLHVIAESFQHGSFVPCKLVELQVRSCVSNRSPKEFVQLRWETSIQLFYSIVFPKGLASEAFKWGSRSTTVENVAPWKAYWKLAGYSETTVLSDWNQTLNATHLGQLHNRVLLGSKQQRAKWRVCSLRFWKALTSRQLQVTNAQYLAFRLQITSANWGTDIWVEPGTTSVATFCNSNAT